MTQETPSSDEHKPESDKYQLELVETNGRDISPDNTCSPPENCCGDESRSLDNSTDNDPLMSCLWGDGTPGLEDAPSKFPTAGDDSWEDNCACGALIDVSLPTLEDCITEVKATAGDTCISLQRILNKSQGLTKGEKKEGLVNKF
ncbi:hypothetical protein HHK36_000998 [Tetracentron sinense]|uniref:Uncharacterized protein n=1 Tax=Tetracentron sinense TaxID=13715 RepID=A0A834ZS19_TETSI|nr:hypothetical protein HHK36_000998 [Tetracentron sinense]